MGLVLLWWEKGSKGHHLILYLLENVGPLLELRDIYCTQSNEMNVHEGIRNNLQVSSLWGSG